MRGVNAVATRTARPSGVHVGIARLSVAHRTFLGCAAQHPWQAVAACAAPPVAAFAGDTSVPQGAPPAPDASKQPARPTPPQHAPLPKAGLPVRQARAESPARDTRRDVLIPISGPPSDAPPELRRMQHPADAADVAPTSIVEVATPQQLAIGKREAREQAVALATASAEILKWKAVAEESLEAKRVLTARCSELQAQRDESMSINKDLVAGFKHVTAQLSLTQKQVQEQQQRLAAMQAALIAVRAAIEPEGGEGAAPARWGGAAQRQAQAGARTGAAGGDLSEQHMAQLTQLSGQMARDAQRDDERRELLKAQLLGAGAGASSNGNGAAAAAAPVAKSGSNGSGNGNGTAARGAMAAANGKGVPAAAASEAA